jgi:hypothetical protein
MMIAWINLITLIVATVLGLYCYVKSANPENLDSQNNQSQSLNSIRYQTWAELLMTLVGINYIVYFLYPIPLSIPQVFPWSWWVSATIATAIALLSIYYWWRSLIEKTIPMTILGNHESIYQSQVISDLTFWLVLGFLLHSPFLVLFSLTWIPLYLLLNWWEHSHYPHNIEGSFLT